jgi:hypothetical protein
MGGVMGVNAKNFFQRRLSWSSNISETIRSRDDLFAQMERAHFALYTDILATSIMKFFFNVEFIVAIVV